MPLHCKKNQRVNVQSGNWEIKKKQRVRPSHNSQVPSAVVKTPIEIIQSVWLGGLSSYAVRNPPQTATQFANKITTIVLSTVHTSTKHNMFDWFILNTINP